jgi:hypothetical protein
MTEIVRRRGDPSHVGVLRIVGAPPFAFLAPMNRLAYGERMTCPSTPSTRLPGSDLLDPANGAGEDAIAAPSGWGDPAGGAGIAVHLAPLRRSLSFILTP